MFLCKILLFRNYLKTTVRLMTAAKLIAYIKNAQHQLVTNSWSFFFHKIYNTLSLYRMQEQQRCFQKCSLTVNVRKRSGIMHNWAKCDEAGLRSKCSAATCPLQSLVFSRFPKVIPLSCTACELVLLNLMGVLPLTSSSPDFCKSSGFWKGAIQMYLQTRIDI